MLVAVILSGGGGMPALDVALYHGLAPSHAPEAHFESSGSPHSHGELCRLGYRLPYSRHPAALDLGISVAVICFPEVALAATTPRAHDRGLLPQPRAPPSLPA
jgi:hypothetical protein